MLRPPAFSATASPHRLITGDPLLPPFVPLAAWPAQDRRHTPGLMAPAHNSTGVIWGCRPLSRSPPDHGTPQASAGAVALCPARRLPTTAQVSNLGRPSSRSPPAPRLSTGVSSGLTKGALRPCKAAQPSNPQGTMSGAMLMATLLACPGRQAPHTRRTCRPLKDSLVTRRASAHLTHVREGHPTRQTAHLQIERVEVIVPLLSIDGRIPVEPRQRACQDGDLGMHQSINQAAASAEHSTRNPPITCMPV